MRNLMKTIVLGGGASGMMAAIIAARNNQKVILIERNNMLGKKLLATGNGKCNFSNMFCSSKDYFDKEKFVENSFNIFGVKETLKFFRELGVLEREEAEGRIYPFSNQATAILDALRFEIESLNMKVMLSTKVNKIAKKNQQFSVLLENGQEILGDRVILSTGGNAGPVYGSTGDGFKFAIELGHIVNKTRPALTKLICRESYFAKLKGVRARGKVTVANNNNDDEHSDIGEIQFTENGISGICVFNISRFVLGPSTIATIDLFPDFTEAELYEILRKRIKTIGDRPISMLLNGMINSKITPVLLNEINVDRSTKEVKDIDENLMCKIVLKLKNWNLKIAGTSDFMDAQTTVGGIKLEEVNENTLESKITPGLFFAGEILDVDAKCGGYNLQWAWTSGYVAGISTGGK
jgi:predicted Rossmann fold flavoprotein